MSSRWKNLRLPLAACVIALGGIGADCDGDDAPLNTGCNSGSAQISLTDGIIRRICGCAESDSTIVTPLPATVCSAPAGTVIFVHYQASKARHQLVPVGSPAIPASHVWNGVGTSSVPTFVFTLGAAGTYQFKDQFDGLVQGSFVSL